MSINQEADLVSDVFQIDVSPSRLSDAERAKILADPGFGRFFSDHMSIIYWDANKGWHGRVSPSFDRSPFIRDVLRCTTLRESSRA